MGFYYLDGSLFCEDLKVKDIIARVGRTPFYLYSAGQIKSNFLAYSESLVGIPSVISYAVKANGNLNILKLLRSLGCWVTLASGNELKLALEAGFEPEQAILNGNGKTLEELRFAIGLGVIVNIDSEFDLIHIQRVARELKTRAKVIIRVNPDIDPEVHPYISTGLLSSKFGVALNEAVEMVKILAGMQSIQLLGVHCHLGSNINNINVYQRALTTLVELFQIAKQSSDRVRYINLGGGLGIDYHHDNNQVPSPQEFIQSIRAGLPEDAILILEPGRSIVGNAGVLVCRVIGVKNRGDRHFIVVDGSMAELIRPSLYSAYHEVGFVELVKGGPERFDIVGPVCESADFLGKDRLLPPPNEGAGVVIFDAGAYGYAMSSNYNGKVRPAEYLVDGDQLFQIRKKESFEDTLRLFDERGIL